MTSTQSIKRFALAVTLGAFVLLQGCSLWPFGKGDDRAQIIAQLTRQSEDWDKAIVRKDRAAIEKNMAEDFRHIDGSGEISGKFAFVEDLVSPKLVIDPYLVEDFEVRLYGDIALLSGRTKMTGHLEGKAFTSNYRYIDIYAKRAGVWQVISVQISRIPDPK